MVSFAECAKNFKILALDTKDQKESKKYLEFSKQFKKLDKKMNKIKKDDIKFAHRLQVGIDASKTLAKTTKNDNNRIRYNNITNSLQNLQKRFLNIK